MKRAEILGLPVDLLDMEKVIARIAEAVKKKDNCLIITLNAEMAVKAHADQELRDIIRRASLVLPDGSGILWALRRKYGLKVPRITGIDLLIRLVKCYEKQWRFYFLGAREGIAERAGEIIFTSPYKKYLKTRHGYFSMEEEKQIIQEIREFKPHLLAVGMGTPRQEKWLEAHRKSLRVPVLIGLGGAFDCLSGRLKRAPQWMQEKGLEWLFRVLQEPRRVPRLLSLIKFYILVQCKEKLHGTGKKRQL